MVRRPLLLTLVGLAMLAGCRPESGRLAISGTVTLDGAPLDGGAIRFTSLGEKTLTAGAMVQDGRFLVPQQYGLPAGTYHVQINAPDETAPPVMFRNAPDQPGILTARERIPADYNSESKHSIELTAGGKNEFVFDIVSRGAPDKE